MHRSAPEGARVLIIAPYGRDAASIADLLVGRGYSAATYRTFADMCVILDTKAGVVLMTEEALTDNMEPLEVALAAQPSWSDVPFILLVSRPVGRRRHDEELLARLPKNATNVVLLERPLGSESLLSAVASAMRARQRQFVMRDQLMELESQRTRLRTLLDNLPVGVAFLDLHGESIVANPEFGRFTRCGKSAAFELGAEREWHATSDSGAPLIRDQFPTARALKGERTSGVEFIYTGLPSGPIWTRVTSVPLRDEDGLLSGAITVVVDIDDQKRAQEKLERAAATLESQVTARTADLERALEDLRTEAAERSKAETALRQAQKMEAVGQLTGGIAHDFNNMLTGVIGALDLIKRRIATGRYDDLERFMEAASMSARRAANLTSRLLAFSRRQSLDSKPTDVRALVLSLSELLQHTVHENVSVEIETGTNVPAAIVDANQLENAVLNLAINARDAMPDGGKLTVETLVVDLDEAYCRVHADILPGKYVVVAVSDTGVGMSSDLLDKVFDPFFTTKPIGQGTGLGLSMVYGFARQSNGQVRIESSPGRGTRVRIFLPAAEQAVDETQKSLDTVAAGVGQTVLLVEDDASVRLLIGEVLAELGYHKIEASDANVALTILETRQSIDMMISDVGLPGMNGRQLAEVARTHYPSMPILFVTGYAENAAIRAGFLGTNMAMISKPFQMEALAAKIGELLACHVD